jgi:antitoxin (DNA-binding transcriptional repressor) of toxin-antitoxin stability system
MTEHMKSNEVRTAWRDVLEHVRLGGSVVVEHYNRSIARVIPEDDTLVVLRARNANDAERLRRLVAEHGSVGIPFPNNSQPTWKVTDETGTSVNPHLIPSVGAQNAFTDETPPPTRR